MAFINHCQPSSHGSAAEPEGFTERLCVLCNPDFGRQQPLAARTCGTLTEDKITDVAVQVWPEMETGRLYMMEVHRAYQDDISRAARGGGGSFKNRKPIGEIRCCESQLSDQKHCLIVQLSNSLTD